MVAFIKQHECLFQVESTEMPKHSRKRDLELSMPGKAQSPRKSAKSSDTAAGAVGINILASETLFGIKDAVLRELIGMGKW